jgi:FAD dependent oxidoreductase TIGR03364
MEITANHVRTSKASMQADLIVVCSGIWYDLLFPDAFRKASATRCKLQMLRFGSQPEGERIGPALCGGLSLAHYHSFRVAASLPVLKQRFASEMPEYLEWGIHVMVSQNGRGELTVGDSHEYGPTHDPFDRQHINDKILSYLRTFARFGNEQVTETWNGTYTRLTNGNAYLWEQVLPGVYLFNGLGGAGMTLSFGLSEKLADAI